MNFDLVFGRPEFLYVLIGIVALAIALIALEARSGRRFQTFVTRVMQQRLAFRVPRARRTLSLIGLCGALSAFVIALAQPQTGAEVVETPLQTTELLVAIDVSKSMLAEDVVPNRLERAKAEILDLLPYLRGDQVGLIGFAGSALLACPLTPDHGFVSLVLDELGPASVGQGGTRLAAPIELALDSFGATADRGRALFIFTDGEDHDEYALDAATEAAERGIQIITIGFGDESGAPITITDPDTGARNPLRDVDGKIVNSRLNSELLAKIATETGGIYIPAGTGVLDLESIYQTYIAPLTRGELDGKPRVIRSEAFQIPLLIGIGLLLFGLALRRGAKPLSSQSLNSQPSSPQSSNSRSSSVGSAAVGSAAVVRAALVALALGVIAPTVAAQNDPSATNSSTQTADAPTSDESTTSDSSGTNQTAEAEEIDKPSDARECYNLALELFKAGELDDAEELYVEARRLSRSDGEVRFAATFDLGLVDARRAELAPDDEPEVAIGHYERAISWFEEAIRMRPESARPRRNLEIAQRRRLALRDAMLREDPPDYPARLRALMDNERNALNDLTRLAEAARSVPDPLTTEPARTLLRDAARAQRFLRSDVSALLRDAADERDALERELEAADSNSSAGSKAPGTGATGPATNQDETRLRSVRIQLMQNALESAEQRIAQARRQLRVGVPDAAVRRAAIALAELRRALDPFLDPAQRTADLLAEETRLARETSVFGSTSLTETPPAWLDAPYLFDRQQQIEGRTRQLSLELQAVTAQSAEATAAAEAAPDPEQEAALDKIRQAAPFIEQAVNSMAESRTALDEDRPRVALDPQREAISALSHALERFADLKRLIEITAADVRALDTIVEDGGVTLPAPTPDAEPQRFELAALAQELEQVSDRNCDRLDRVLTMIDDERAKAAEAATANPAAPGAGGTGPTPGESEPNPELERLDLARQLTLIAQAALESSRDAASESPIDETVLAPSIDRAHESVEQLRRLFFTLAELVLDTARRQQELADEFRLVQSMPVEEQPAEIAPRTPRQTELTALSNELGTALKTQADQIRQQASNAPAGGAAGGTDARNRQFELADRYEGASEKTHAAHEAMAGASSLLDMDDVDLATVTTSEDRAVQLLLEAYALLSPPPPPPEDGQDEESQQEENSDESEPTEPSDDQQQATDVSQLLQQIRDQEQERRDERKRENARAVSGEAAGGKDW